MKDATPMMSQYKSLKARDSDALLFFRLGDFYELFYEDAETGSRELGIALTGRDAGNGQRAPMCGVPYHSVDDYIKVLVGKGYKVAICEQLEDPALAKGLVKRDVTRVITPGTYWEGADSAAPSYIASIAADTGGAGREEAAICACDLATGDVLVASFRDEPSPGGRSGLRTGKSDARERALEELSKLMPAECLVAQGKGSLDLKRAVEKSLPGALVTVVSDGDSPTGHGRYSAASHVGRAGATTGDAAAPCAEGATAQVLGPEVARAVASRGGPCLMAALEALMSYLVGTQMAGLRHLKEPVFYLDEGYVEIDPSTRRNLELLERLQGGRDGTLAWVLDRCRTSMGSRLLKQWIARPLKDSVQINRRLDAVEILFDDSALRQNLREALSRVKDLERLVTRIAYKSCNARDLVAAASSLEAVGPIRAMLESKLKGEPPGTLLQDILSRLDDIPEVQSAVRDAIVPDPPMSVTEGYLVRDGFSREVDELRDFCTGGKKWVLELEARERERTGIKSLKVGFNKVFGYYIEVTRPNLDSVPEDYIRRQTLSTGERFTTRELKEKESAILGAEEKLHREEYRIFCEVRDLVWTHARRIQKTARAVSELDVLVSLAEAAAENGYVRPEVHEKGDTVIKDGRHPVLEKVLPPGQFVPNDAVCDEKQRVLVITGPNMGGKSTYCRQTALIVLMAQMGSFVPAKSCSISCVDKIFARIGAYDDLVLGQSTFMVEMSEVSRILKGLTPRSLVILDEIGRGTSTFDGLAVAWAVLEHLCSDWSGEGPGAGEGLGAGPRALVATHYRELTLLSDLKPGVANYNVSVKKKGDEIVFLRKVVRGVAEGSFGIEVSAMAGLPEQVVRRAKEILLGLEAEARRGSRWRTGILGQVASRGATALHEEIAGQASLFAGEASDATSEGGRGTLDLEIQDVLEDLCSLDLDRLSPIEALRKLYEVKERLTALGIPEARAPEGGGRRGRHHTQT